MLTLSLVDGTADGSDYEAAFEVSLDGGQTWSVSNGTVTLTNGGDQEVLVRTQTIDDAMKEAPETYALNATLVSGADTLNATGTATINDEPVGQEDTVLVSIAGPGSVVEGSVAQDYTVTLSEAVPAGQSVTVDLVYSGVAQDGSDFTKVAQVTIPAGETSVKFDITTLDDVLAEGSEDFTITLGNINDGGVFEAIKADPSSNAVTTTINDEPVGQEDTVLVSIAGPGSVVEGSVAQDYTVTLSEAVPAGQSVTVDLVYSGVAQDGSDFTKVAQVTIPAGETSVKFDITTLDDVLAEGSEDFTITLGNINDGGVFEAIKADPSSHAVTTTINDEPVGQEDTVLVSIAGPGSVVEGSVAQDYTVTLSEAVPAGQSVTVDLVYSGVAQDGSDFTKVAQVTIPAGETSVKFDITTLDDVLAEGSEDFTITLGNINDGGVFEAIKADPSSNAVTTTINDEPVGQEDTVLVSIAGPGSVVEGSVAQDYTVTLSEAVPAGQSVTVDLVYSGVAQDGSDFTKVAQVTIPAGETSVKFDITTLDDVLAEGSEDFTITLGNINDGGVFEAIKADPSSNAVTTTINDEPVGQEDTVLVSIAGPGSVVEGSVAQDYTVTLSEAVPAGQSVTVDLVYSGVAQDGSDFTKVAQVTIPAGETSVKFDITTLDDVLAEGSEDFTITLGNINDGGVFEAIKADPSSNAVTTTINDEPVGQEDTVLVSIAGPGSVVEGSVAQDYTVTLSEAVPAGQSVTVDLVYSGVAQDGSDFTKVAQVTIPAGETSVKFDITTLDDVLAEGSEDFTITLGNINDGGIFEAIAADSNNNQVITSIVDNDLPTFTLTAIDGSASNAVNEGEVAGYQIRIGNKGVADGIDVTLELKVTEGTALNPEDFTGLQGITFDAAKGVYVVTLTGPLAPNSVVANLSANTVEDTVYESNENFNVSLESTSLGSVSGSVETTILNDDAAVLNPIDVVVNEAGLVDGSNPGIGHIVTGNLLGSDASLSISNIAGGVLDANTGIITVTTVQGVLTVETTGANAGQYQYQLNDTFAHQAGNGTNTADNANSFDITVSGHNGVATNLKLNVDIVDDIPTANIVSPDPIDFTQQTTNLIFVLDVSGSMGWDMEGDRSGDANWGGTSRLEIAKQSLSKLIDAYSNLGDVNIKIVSFQSSVDKESGWLTLAEAKSFLAQLNASGGTDYDDALRALVDGFNPPTKADGSAADLTKVYFLSDGEPGSNTDRSEITSYQPTWEAFVNEQGIEAEAVGIGSNVPSQYLDIVSHPSKPDGSEPTQIVTTANGLMTVLLDSVKAVVNGDVDTKVLGNISTGINYGADGGFIESIEVDGKVVNRPSGTDLKVKIDTQNGGELVFDFATGEYSYVVTMGDKPANSDTFADNIIVNIVDNDGDKVSSDFDISVKFPVIDTTPVANVDADQVNEVVSQPDNDPSAMINGNVLVNDMFGKDVTNPVIGVVAGTQNGNVSGGTSQTIAGSFGSLVLNTDGSYVYILNNKNAQVQALNEGETLLDSFTYTITDDNGDLSSAVLNITINGVTDPMLDAIDDSASTFVGQPVYIDILNNDVNPADSNPNDANTEITITGIKVISGSGEAYIVNGELVYVPGKDQETAQIEYYVTNSRGEVDTAVVTVNVTQRDFTGSTLTGESGNDQITTVTGTDSGSKEFQLQLGGYNGYKTENGQRVWVNIGARDERLIATQEEQLIDSSGGNDYVKGSIGSDTIYLGDGFRELDAASTKAFLDQEALKDQAELDAYHTSSVSSSIVDIADGGAGDDVIYGGSQGVDDPSVTQDALERPISHYDYIYGNDGNDMIDGGLGYDVLRGGSGNDLIKGGEGDDDIAGNSGNDILIGGEGSDTFRFFAEDIVKEADNTKQDTGVKDTIIDFDINSDKLHLSDLLQGELPSTIDDYLTVYENANGGIDIVVDADGKGASTDTMTITLEGVSYSDAGAGIDTGSEFIQKLIQDGKLIID
ncbi:Calx-beta domain-containing protein [Motilimonas sp. 1_MG-2023]|uniref:Calx-beta domain-containing protein n=1 Tax=Motilimonas sp. 1_MG-2023 TaxID=3062672 RepID=UPI0026E3C616|nr:Calx-beta domain-containing protein [Motilimonas sp. 1_MG-2023]MDO6525671.1 Calx-beta domain-containing protein [Motilimonas sp. 1_MG-2023]